MDDIKTKTAKGVSWSVAQRVGTQVIQFLVFLGLARLLEPSAFGLLALALVYVTSIQIFVEQGFGDAIIQHKSPDADFLNTAFWINLAGGTFFCVIGIAIAGPVSLLFSQPDLAPVLRWMSPLFLINAMTVVPLCLLRRSMRFKALTVRSLAQWTAGGAIAMTMALCSQGIRSLVALQLSAGLIGLVLLWTATDWRPEFRFSLASAKALVWFGANISGGNLLNVFNRQGDKLVIGYFLGPVALGYYTIAYQMLLAVSNLLVGTINNVALPLFSRLQHDPRRLLSALNKVTNLTSSIAIPVFAGVGVLASEIIPLCFGSQWQPSVAPLQVLCAIGILYAGFYFHGPVLTAVGKPQWYLWLNAIQAAGNALAFLIGVRWGIVGVALAYVLRAYLMAPIHILVLRRQVGLQPLEYLREFLPSSIAAIVMLLAILGLKLVVLGTLPPVAVIALCVPIGGIVYASCLLLLQPGLKQEAVEIVRSIVCRQPQALSPS